MYGFNFKVFRGDVGTYDTWRAAHDGQQFQLSYWPEGYAPVETLPMPEQLRVAVYHKTESNSDFPIESCVNSIIQKTEWKLETIYLDGTGTDDAYREMIRQGENGVFDIIVINPLDWFVGNAGPLHIEDARRMTKQDRPVGIYFPWLDMDSNDERCVPILTVLAQYEEAKRHGGKDIRE